MRALVLQDFGLPPSVERTYALDKAFQALAAFASGKRGKLVVTPS